MQKGSRTGVLSQKAEYKKGAQRVKTGRRKGAARGFQGTKGVHKGCRKGVLAQKAGRTKGAQRVQKGCRKGAGTPLPAKGRVVENPSKRTVSDKSKDQPP